MKKILLVLVSLWLNGAFAQSVIYENYFNGYGNYQHFPKDGWVEEGVPNANWQFSAHMNNLAGGEDSELLLAGSPVNPFNGMSRAVSPIIDMSGYSEVVFHFRYGGKRWMSQFEIGVATRSGNGDWHVIWSYFNQVPISGFVDPEEVSLFVSNEDIGQPDFQLCFYFDGPNSFSECKYLAFDDLVISEVVQHDIYTMNVSNSEQVLSGGDLIVDGTYYNNGNSVESFDAVLNIYDYNGNMVFEDTQNISNLESGSEITVSFDPYTVTSDDDLFTIEITHNLETDVNPENDIKDSYFNSYTTPRNMVLFEVGTATWCQYCPGVALAIDDFVANGDNIAAIEYHGSDDFTTGNISVRFGTQFYNSYSFPTTVFDGKYKYFGGSASQSVYDSLFPFYAQRIMYNSPVTVTMSVSNTSQQSYDVNVYVQRNAPILEHEYHLFLVLVESDIQYSWGPLEELNFVERGMWPDVYGLYINLNNNTNLEEEFSITVPDSVVIENSELVAFVQDMNTLEILQTAKSGLISTGTPEVETVKPVSVYPNPSCNGIFTVQFGEKSRAGYEVVVRDVMGKIVKRYDNIRSSSITLSGIETGIYLMQVLKEGEIIGTEKIIVE